MASGPPWKAWYKTARWRALRLQVFERDLFTCQAKGCGRLIGDTSQLVCDHVEPHRGNEQKFWAGPFQTLCKPCHDRVKQKEEQATRHHRGVWDFADAGMNATTRQAVVPGASSKMGRPAWFRRVHVPTTIVCGPPGAGKSTYVRSRAAVSDRIIDFDEIAARLFKSAGIRATASLSAAQTADVLRVRNEAIADLMHDRAKQEWSGAWIILTEPVAENRQWWADTLGARVIVLATPAEECTRRIGSDRAAGDDRGPDAASAARDWWHRYHPAACDQTLTI